MAHPYIPNLLILPHGVGLRSQHMNLGQEDCNTVVRIQILWQSSRESPQKSLALGVQYVCARIIRVLRLSLDPPGTGSWRTLREGKGKAWDKKEDSLWGSCMTRSGCS